MKVLLTPTLNTSIMGAALVKKLGWAILLVPILLGALSAQEKGIRPIPAEASAKAGGQTFAVVVGISDYQSEDIPDLYFADKDAAVFASFLRAQSGGSLDDQHLKVLTNEEATTGRLVAALDWLMDVCKENDRAIIYFSGHGDVEAKTAFQLGFLLTWDSPGRSYMAGAYPVYYLQAVIATLSEHKAKIVLITDACHAGKLAGSPIGGPQITGANLSKQFASEIKILSCQPNEYSLEGEQWGGGRGAFSYHLVDGLYGLADKNKDAYVSLSEIDRYLEDHVTSEVAPQVQMPMVLGNKSEQLASVVPEILENLQKFKSGQIPQFTPVAQRGLEDDVLATADSSTRELYAKFILAMQQKRLLEPIGHCADEYYNQLAGMEILALIQGLMKRNYAAALQDEAQQSINAILRADPDYSLGSRKDYYESYKDFPKLLHRAADLLGEQHYMYKNLKAREYLFEGVLLYFKNLAAKNTPPEQANQIIEYYQKALAYEPEFPVVHFFMSICYSKMIKDPEQAKKYAESAVALAGTWTRPYVHLAYLLAKESRQFDAAKKYLDLAMAIDSTDAAVWKGLLAWHAYQRKIPEALEAAQTAARLAPDDPYIWLNIGSLKQSQYKYEEAEAALLKSIELDSTLQRAYNALAKNAHRWDKLEKAEAYYLKALELDPEDEVSRSALAKFYIGWEKYEAAEFQFLELIKYTDPDAKTWYYLAVVSTVNGHHDAGLEYLETALKKGYKDQAGIEAEEGLAPLRTMPEYAAMMDKYFKK